MWLFDIVVSTRRAGYDTDSVPGKGDIYQVQNPHTTQ